MRNFSSKKVFIWASVFAIWMWEIEMRSYSKWMWSLVNSYRTSKVNLISFYSALKSMKYWAFHFFALYGTPFAPVLCQVHATCFTSPLCQNRKFSSCYFVKVRFSCLPTRLFFQNYTKGLVIFLAHSAHLMKRHTWKMHFWVSKYIKQGVCHTVALPFTLKSMLRQKKKNYGNSNISPCKNIIFKKKIL